MSWKDETSYSQTDKVRIPKVYTQTSGNLRVTVHTYLGCGDIWFVTCHQLQLDRETLNTSDLVVAKFEAVVRVLRVAEDNLRAAHALKP